MEIVLKLHPKIFRNLSADIFCIVVTGLPVADLGEGPRGPGPPLFVEYLQKIYKKVNEMSIQKPF